MIKIQTIRSYLLHAKILPVLIVICSVFVGIFSYVLSTAQTSQHTVDLPKQQIAGISIKITITPTQKEKAVEPIVFVAQHITPEISTPTPTNQPSGISITQETHENTSVKVIIPTVTAIPTPTVTLASISITPTPTVDTDQSVTLQIVSSNTNATFSIELHAGATVCDVLQKAKDEGKIQSLTFNDAYLSAYHSRYVTEINGLINNWTFTVNGTSPLGCSLSTPRNHDVIVWKYS